MQCPSHRHIIMRQSLCKQSAITVSAALVSFIFSLPVSATLYVDNDGIQWEIIAGSCPDSGGNGKCVSGWYDTDNAGACGQMPVYGTWAAATFSVAVFGTEAIGCETKHYRGISSPETLRIQGHWNNNNQIGRFFLKPIPVP